MIVIRTYPYIVEVDPVDCVFTTYMSKEKKPGLDRQIKPTKEAVINVLNCS